MARVILCCIRGLPQFSEDILRLCVKYKKQGVVGIDIAGDEEGLDPKAADMFEQSTYKVFEEAKKLGVNRTVHAGEVGPPKCVEQALDRLHAQRIGHGYRVLGDQALYARCLKERVHFETCPTSSILTGAQPLNIFYHAICRFLPYLSKVDNQLVLCEHLEAALFLLKASAVPGLPTTGQTSA